MDIRSEGKFEGIIHNDTRYIRFSSFDSEINGWVSDWWIRDPLDKLTRVRDFSVLRILDETYLNVDNK